MFKNAKKAIKALVANYMNAMEIGRASCRERV